MALKTFQEAVEKVSAYQDFLKKQEINSSEIKTLEDFQTKVPITTKNNYLSQYSLTELSSGEIKKESFGICFTSGTSSSPVAILPSKTNLPFIINGLISFLHYWWEIRSPSNYTLWINGFALGPWGASLLANVTLAKEAEKYNFSLATIGSNPEMMVEVLERIGRSYNQVIVGTPPSVLKIFFEEGEKRKINWKEFNIKIVSGTEPMSENFKEYILNKIDPHRKDPWRIWDLFGTTETSVFGFGTPLATVIHQLLTKDEELCTNVFGQREIQNLFQYNPVSSFIEEVEGELTVTRPGIIPVIRYQIGDLGKVISFSELTEILEKRGYNLENLLKKAGWQKGYFKWPFFTYLGRADDMITIYSGAKVYPQNLFNLLEKPETKEIRNFKLTTKTDEKLDKRLIVYLELKPDLKPSSEELLQLEKKYQKLVHEELLKTNIEYKDAYHLNPEKAIPIIKIFSYSEGPFKEDQGRPKPKMVI